MKYIIFIGLLLMLVAGILNLNKTKELAHEHPYFSEHALTIYQEHDIWRQMKYVLVAYAKPEALKDVHYAYAYPFGLSSQQIEDDNIFAFGINQNDSVAIIPANEDLIRSMLLFGPYVSRIDFIVFQKRLENAANEPVVLSHWNNCTIDKQESFNIMLSRCRKSD